MPSPLPSSFASAAAGNGVEGVSNGRGLTRGDSSGDWSRARTNGATQTFRRPSQATNLSHQRENSQSNTTNAPSNTGVYVPPHLNSNYQSSYSRNGASAESRYSKDQLLDLFRAQSKSGPLNTGLQDLFVDGWHPGATNGNSNGGWGKKEDHKEVSTGPDICWDHEGKSHPLALVEMEDHEKEAFAASVNSPLKPPIQNSNKDSTSNNGNAGRRTSVSQIQNNASTYSVTPPSTRPGPRRRETSESLQSGNLLTSPTGNNKFSRDESSTSTPLPSLLKRRTDLKEGAFGPSLGDTDKDEPKSSINPDSPSPYGNLRRTTTGPLSASINGPSSPWSGAPQSAGFSPMGTFGNFSLGSATGQPPTPGERKPTLGSLRGESRFKGLMGVEKSEESAQRIKERASINSLEKLTESPKEPPTLNWGAGRSARPMSTESNPYEDSQPRTGSAALGSDDASPLRQFPSRSRNPDRQTSYDEIGFSALGSSSDLPPFREMLQRREYSQQQTPQSQNQRLSQGNEPMSPTDTNPYYSPENEKGAPEDFDTDDSDLQNTRASNAAPFAHLSRGLNAQFETTANESGHVSSAGPTRGFPTLGAPGGLGGLGSSGGWSAAPGAVGTPSRVTPGYSGGFGDSIFGSLGDLQSPNYAGLSGNGGFGSAGTSTNAGPIGRGSKMGSLFPTAMQEQIRGDSTRQDNSNVHQLSATRNPSAMNAPGFGGSMREIDSPPRPGRGMLDDLFGTLDSRNKAGQALNSPLAGLDIGENTVSHLPTSMSSGSTFSSAPALSGTPSLAGSSFFGRTHDQDSSTAASSQMPAAQQRQMVMPDRMRWIYRDPQGNTQGPWSGLEMHDWYKAGFFSPELQVKKFEDADYEPLAQLIRRIGNSREPFLVPQIGIAHGSSTAQPSSNAPALGGVPATTPSAVQAGSAQPPFASSFPSFGTTLTAEQQNALERRKQEEQYLMARQKEHLAQQQVMIKQMQHLQGGQHTIHSQQLHHHSSAHSLHSQPSYGSITSPGGYQPSPAQGPIQPPNGLSGFFDGLPRNTGPHLGPLGPGHDVLSPVREDEMPGLIDRLNTGRGGQLPFAGSSYIPIQQDSMNHQQQVMNIMHERARMQREQDHFDLFQRGVLDDSQITTDRLEQYHQLRAQNDNQQQFPTSSVIGGQASQLRTDVDISSEQQGQDDGANLFDLTRVVEKSNQQNEPLSLAEQVHKATLAKESPVQAQSPWAKIEFGLPQPFPPPQSSSPLPAPAARRNRQNVADTFTIESRSPSQTPSVETPSAALAPWAKENVESLKGPSLKDIQAAEARKAAQQEEIAIAARRAVAEQERQNQNQVNIPAPGLPSSANWASSASPTTPTSTGSSVWAKPVAGKASVAIAVPGAKKNLAQIQKEEEARKQRVAASAAASTASNVIGGTALPGGKRYADLAGKVTSAVSLAPSGAWTTVGAGGKMKTPTGPAPTPALSGVRLGTGGNVATTAPVAKPKTTVLPGRSTIAGGLSPAQNANDEFRKWVKGALSKGLNPNISVDDFVSQLLILPPDLDLISDSIYGSSQTLDGRRFAEEFIRRRKLADKGLVPEASATGSTGFSPSNTSESKSSGGWSEVAKKGPANGAKEEASSAFKVVAAKKKGKR